MATIKLRRGTAAEWSTANPILANGEPGVEIDTGRYKTGNGTSAWNALPYADNYSLDRAHHTGTQPLSSLDGLLEYIQDRLGTDLVAGAGITITYDDGGTGKTTITSTGGSGTGTGVTDPEVVRDTISTALVAGTGIAITKDDALDTITIAVTAAPDPIPTYASEAAAMAGLAANEFADGDIIVVMV